MFRHLLLAGTALAFMAGGAPAQEAKQGGAMTVTYKDDVSTLDPAIGYDWQNWSMIKSLFNGLMDYAPGTTDLIPDLAESYELSEDGLTYTFKLHEGVKFHNGRELTAEDVKWSIERAVRPETQSPGQGFFGMIAGFDEVAAGEAEELSGIEVVDPHTIRFTLSRPDATFLHVMAINFSFAVPKEAVEEHGQDFGKNPVGTGAYQMTDWTLGQRVVYERNPDYYRDGLPKLDQIVFEVGQEPLVALLRLQRGEVDILGDGIPPAKFLEVKDDPANAGNPRTTVSSDIVLLDQFVDARLALGSKAQLFTSTLAQVHFFPFARLKRDQSSDGSR
jgi:peptide/nickel transport system substrate-binding protein